MTTSSLSDIAPVLSTPDFIVRPLVPVSLALQTQEQNDSNKIENKSHFESKESIDDWLQNLTEKRAQNATEMGKNGRRHQKRHR